MVTGAGYFHFCPICGSSLEVRYIESEEHERLVCVGCGHIIYVNPKLVAGLIPMEGDRIWLLRRAIEPAYGAWTFPAGFMEMGESVPEAAARETREELGAEVEVGPLVGLYSRSTSPTVVAVHTGRVLTAPTGGIETLEFAQFAVNDIPWGDLAFWNTVEALRDWVASIGSSNPDG
jgi:ADP-ribose pyrophosphatase YjhB (NUDIX family)